MRDKTLFRELFNIAAPVALHNLVISSLSFVDTLMIGQLGGVEIAAVGIGNQLFFLYTLLMFGIGSACGVFVSQFWGKKDFPSIKKTSGLSIVLGLIGAAPFAVFSFLIPKQLVGIFSTDPDVIRLGAEYLRVISISYLFCAVSMSMAHVQRSLERAGLPFIVSCAALGINTILNYLFIFGKAGFPAWGVQGVALATTISRFIECVLILILIYFGKDNPAAGSFSEMTAFTRAFLSRFMKTAAPVILNEFFWALGMTVFKIVYGRMGTSALAAVNIAEAVMNLMFVVLLGSAAGASVLTGKKIGEGKPDEARINGKKFIRLAIIEALIIAAICSAFSGLLPEGFNVDDDIKHNTTLIILVFSAFFPFKSFNLHTIVGIFRGGGDTLYAAVIEVSNVWFVGVVIAFITGIWLGWPIYVVYGCISIEEVVKSIICTKRLKSGKWVHDLT